MVDKRMVSRRVYVTDAFLALSVRARDLYTYLNLSADDLGFVDSPRTIMKQIGASKKDLNELIKAGFVLQKDEMPLLIAHWNTLNKIRPERVQSLMADKIKSIVLDPQAPVYQLADECPTDDGQVADKCQTNVGEMSQENRTVLDLDLDLEEKKQERKESQPAPPEHQAAPLSETDRFEKLKEMKEVDLKNARRVSDIVGETYEEMMARVRADAQRLGIAGGDAS